MSPNRWLGQYNDRVELLFVDTYTQLQFTIVRPLMLIIGSRRDHASLQPSTPYAPRPRRAPSSRPLELDVIPGIAPPAIRAVPYVVELAYAHIPKWLREMLTLPEGGKTRDAIKKFGKEVLPVACDPQTHGEYFKALLWAEEFRSE